MEQWAGYHEGNIINKFRKIHLKTNGKKIKNEPAEKEGEK